MKRKSLKVHPYAELLPPMTAAEREALKQDIGSVGTIYEDVILLDGMILDGRSRYEISVELGIECPTKPFPKSWGDPLDYVKSKQTRRHLTESQKACVAVNFGDQFEQRAKSQNSDSGRYVSNDDLAALFAVNRDHIFKARLLRRESPKLFGEVFAGKLAVHAAVLEHKRSRKSKALKKLAKQVAANGGAVWKVITGDCMGALPKLPDKSARLIFTDPKYNIGVDYGNGNGADSLHDDDYTLWLTAWLEECARILTDDGAIVVMIDGAHLAEVEMILGHRELRTANIASPGLGLYRRNVIVWHETFGVHQTGNFPDCWRAMIYYTKSPTDFVWHGDQIHIPSARQATYKDKRANPSGKVPTNVWSDIPRIVGNDRERIDGVENQIPSRLVERFILALTDPGDLVLDPASGSGTTGRACLRTGRRYIGIELNPDTANLSRASLTALERELQEGK